MVRVDVVVVGAGVMGSATAWWLAQRGREVALVEQFEAGHSRGSSHGGSRIFRFAYREPEYARMAQEALPLWRRLEEEAGARLLDITGGVDFGDPGSVGEVAGALSSTGAAHEVLDPEEATARWPGMRFDGLVVYSPDAGRCRADDTVAALQRCATARGADISFGTGPAALVGGGGRVTVRAGEAQWSARAVVVTAGAWAARVTAGLVDRLPPLQVTCEQVQHFAPLDPAHGPAWPSFIHHRDPWVYGLWTPGEGVKVARHLAGRPVDPDDGPFAPDPAIAAALAEHVRRWFPGLDPSPVHAATCLYTVTPDHAFVLERSGPVVVDSPCSGHGFKFAPLVGRRLADLADEALRAG